MDEPTGTNPAQEPPSGHRVPPSSEDVDSEPAASAPETSTSDPVTPGYQSADMTPEPTAEVPSQPTAEVPSQPTAEVPSQPTAEVPSQPTTPPGSIQPPGAVPYAFAPPPGTAPGSPPPGAVPPGPPPPGAVPPYGAFGYGVSPPYHGGPGYPGNATWPESGATWAWPTAASKAPRRLGMTILTMIVTAGVALAAAAGVLIGHALWHNTSTTSGATPSASSPLGNSGEGSNPFGSGNSGSGQGSSASGSPSDAASIAHNVDPGLVDVNTSISYDGVQGAGTGMVLTPAGEVLTNNHVVEGATKISVTDVGNGKTYDATVLGYDRSEDIAILQLVGASGLQTVSLGDSSKVSVGEGVVAIGNANGAGGTPSYAGGSVTAINQSITASDEIDGTSEQLNGLIQTNANIISGDSGGPLVNSSGQVIGMDTAGSGGFQFQSPSTSGFAIPIDRALSTAKLIKAGSASATVHVGPTAFLGVVVQSVSGNGLGLGGFGGLGSGNGNGSSSSTSGAYITEVGSGSPASQAGLVPGDTITSVDGQSVTSANALTSIMVVEKPDASVPVQYVDTSGQQQTTTVTLGTGPPQ